MIGSVELTGVLGDLVYVVITVAFFALALALLRACEGIVGPDETIATSESADRAPGLEGELEGGGAMTFDNGVALLLSILVMAYLVAALVKPEKF